MWLEAVLIRWRAVLQPCISEFQVHVLVLPERVIGRWVASLTLSSGIQCWEFHHYSRSISGDTRLPPQWEHTVNMSLLLPVSSSTAEIRQGELNNSPNSYSFKEDLVQCGSLGMKNDELGLGAEDNIKRTLCLSGGTRGHNHDYPFPLGKQGTGLPMNNTECTFTFFKN